MNSATLGLLSQKHNTSAYPTDNYVLPSELAGLLKNVGDRALKRRISVLVSHLMPYRDRVVLDCGCGDGLHLRVLRQLGFQRSYGLEFDPENVEKTSKHLAPLAPPLAQMDLRFAAVRSESADALFSSEVLEHIDDDVRAMQELYRLLKPGGIALITVPNHNYPFLWDPLNKILESTFGIHVQSGFWAGIWNQHLRLYTIQELSEKLRSVGFEIEQLAPLTHHAIPFEHILIYGLKRILLSGLLPKAISNSGDKFAVQAKEQSRLVHLGYDLLRRFDRLDDHLPPDASSVSLFVRARKR